MRTRSLGYHLPRTTSTTPYAGMETSTIQLVPERLCPRETQLEGIPMLDADLLVEEPA